VATLRELAAVCEQLARTRSRRDLARQVADFLGGLEAEEVRPAVRFLLGQAGRGGAVSGQTLWPVLLRLVGAAAPADVWAGAVARAHMLEGDLGEVAALALAHRGGPLPASALAYFRPLRPMLAHTAESVGEALAAFAGRAGVEWKLDGARVQVHRRGDECRLYSRRLQDLT